MINYNKANRNQLESNAEFVQQQKEKWDKRLQDAKEEKEEVEEEQIVYSLRVSNILKSDEAHYKNLEDELIRLRK